MSRKSRVPMPEKSSVVDGGKPVMNGTRNVAPNIATTCWAPSPIVRGQVSRSPGSTISCAPTFLPSPCSVQGSAMRVLNRSRVGIGLVLRIRAFSDEPESSPGHQPTILRESTISAPTSAPTTSKGRFDRFFEISARGTTWGTEVRGGVLTFVTMAYIVILNPLILGGTKDVVGNTLGTTQVAAVTALSAGVMTLLFGLVARLPFAFAAGLGINSFLAVNVVKVLTWPEAMGLVVINGIIIVLLSATGLRKLIFNAVPAPLKTAITVGIGLFIAFIGFVDSGFVRTTNLSSPPVQLGESGSIATLPTIPFLIALVIIGVLMARKVKGALLIGSVAATVVAIIAEAIWHVGPSMGKNPAGWNLTVPQLPTSLVSLPDLSLVGQVDLFGAFGRIGALAATMLIFTLVFTNF